MALFEAFKTDCVLLERTRVADGEGGWTTAWTDSIPFRAAIVLASGINARIAEQQGVTGVYTVTADPNVQLEFHDAFRRSSDGQVFRVTKVNDPTPDMASFQFNQYQAEEWSLT